MIRRRRTVAPQPLLPVARILAESCRWINTARLGVYKVVMAPIGGQGDGRLRAAGLLSPQHYSDSEPSEKDCRQSCRRQRCQSHVQTSPNCKPQGRIDSSSGLLLLWFGIGIGEIVTTIGVVVKL